MYFGEIIGFSCSGTLVESTLVIGSLDIGGWQSVFYIFGGVGIIWYPYWYFSAYETPEQHPSITQEELQLIKKSIELFLYYINMWLCLF